MPEIKHFASHKQPSKRVVAKPHASARRSLITKWHKASSGMTLKRWAHQQKDDVTVIQVKDWFHNKKANFAKPQQCIGRSRSRVKKGGGDKAPEKNLSGK